MPPKSKSKIHGSMRACSNSTGIPYSEVVRAKRNGSDSFRANGNVHEDELVKWLKENPKPQPKAKAKAKKGKKKSEDPIDEEELKKGMAEALKRLQVEELGNYERYEAAKESMDEHEIEVTFKRWKETTSALLSFEVKVDSGMRDSETMIPRREVIVMTQSLMIWLSSAISNVLHNTTPFLAGVESAREAAAIVDPSFREALPIALTYGQRTGKIPKWMMEAALLSTTQSRDHDADLFRALSREVKLTVAEKKAIISITEKIKNL